MYFLSSAQLSIGIEKKIRVQFLNNKSKSRKVEKLNPNRTLNVAIYQIESPPKDLTTITRIPKDSVVAGMDVWTFGTETTPQDLLKLQVAKGGTEDNFIEISGSAENLILGSPFFDAEGRVIGCMVDTLETLIVRKEPDRSISQKIASISILLKYATFALRGLDLNPVWKEVFPTQHIINQVRESTVLLDTEKPGTGIFLGRDKEENGYILTANHVVSAGPERFSVQFLHHFQKKYTGEVIAATVDSTMALAVVKVLNCPQAKPVTFIRKSSLEKQQKLFAPQNIATIGYDFARLQRIFRTDTQEIERIWRPKFGSLTQITEQTIGSVLPLEVGDSGGPVFNDLGEVIGINKQTSPDSTNQSIAVNTVIILDYLEKALRKIKFEKTWDFYEHRSWFSRNISWLAPSGAAVGAAIAFTLLTPTSPKEPLDTRPGFP
jgi:hypothetical protein